MTDDGLYICISPDIFNHTQDDFVDPFDLVVIDEDILEGFKKETRITLGDIRQNLELFQAAKEDRELEKVFLHDLYIERGQPPQEYMPLIRSATTTELTAAHPGGIKTL